MPLTQVTVRYLELAPADFRPRWSPRTDVDFVRVNPPMPALSQSMYNTVGARWFWLDRRGWSVQEWAEWLGPPRSIETWILTVSGKPAGYAELEFRAGGDAEIQYFGLLEPFIGQGMGAHMLSAAVDRALAVGASRVLLNTCDLDHPHALHNYKARGFVEVRAQRTERDLPVLPPG